MDNISLLFQKCILFKDKSLNEIDHFLSNIIYKINLFEKNEIIFSPNQPADTMGIILSGSVEVQKLFPSGKVVIITRKTSTDLIAEPAIFSKLKYYPSTISVDKPCKILFIHKNELLKLFSIDEDIMLNFLESVSNSMLILKHKISLLSLNSIQEKIAGFLFYEYKNNNSNIIKLPFSKKSWAEYINVSRTSLSRELKQLEDDNIISFNKRTIKINNLERLKKIIFQ